MKRFPDRHSKWLCGLMLLMIACCVYADEWVLVKRVIDGDTVALQDDIRLRLNGINAPERNRRGQLAQPGAHEAYLWLKNAIEGQRVRLQYDVERVDSYQRRLVYLFNAQGQHINQHLLLKGLATLSLHPPNLRYQSDLLRAQQTARQQRRGIWGRPYYAPIPIADLSLLPNGRWGQFHGKVDRIERLKPGVRLWFNAKAYVWIPSRYLLYFDVLEMYEGQRVEVMAWSSKRGKKRSLLVRHPSQLRCFACGRVEFE